MNGIQAGRRPASARSLALQALLLAAFAAVAANCNCGAPTPEELDAAADLDAGDGASGSGDDGGAADAGDSDAATLGDGGGGDDGGGLGEDAGDRDGSLDLGDGGAGDAETPCIPKYTSCDGLCGPVTDLCTGQQFLCGGCSTQTVCDLDTHRCVTPRTVDCTGRCGVLKDGCGVRHDCGECEAGQECDRVRGECVPCSNPSCEDLGFQCGEVWLGCGSLSNLTSCGSCPNDSVCNPSSHTCEPACTPAAAGDVCRGRGAECGFVSDGCGGNVDCGGCAAGYACGAHGIGNRCDALPKPFECVIAGRNCGDYQSACGGTVSCGECTNPGEVCNDGVCGPPCAPKDCNAPEYAGKCGVRLDNGCGGKIDCSCAAGLVCSAAATPGAAGLCVGAKDCHDFNATGTANAPCSKQESSAFPKGDGSNLRCECGAGGTCLDASHQEVAGDAAGTCCYNTAVCPTGACATSVPDSCTGLPIPCTCTGTNSHCETALHSCLADATCADYLATGAENAPCSTGPDANWPVGDGRLLTCDNCQSPGLCKTTGGSVEGTCCVNHTVCATDTCNSSVVNDCTGATVQCTCASGKHCEGTSCLGNYSATCATYTTSADGTRCSNAASSSFPKGDGTNLSCPCTGANRHCISASGADVTGSTEGTCCTNDQLCNGRCNIPALHDSCTNATINCTCGGSAYCDTTTNLCVNFWTCSHYSGVGGVAGNDCSRGAVSTWDRGDGTGLTCGCNSGLICVDKVVPNRLVTGSEIGTCAAPKTCTTYTASGQEGQDCSVAGSSSFPKGDGTNLTCACTGGRFCTKDGALVTGGTKGTCCTNHVACATNSCASVVNECTGQTITCGCGTGKYCQTSDHSCQPYKTCSDYSAGGSTVGASCSRGAASGWERGDGTNLTCDCSGGLICTDGTNLVSGATKGTCQARKTCGDYGASGAEGAACSLGPNAAWTVGDGTTLTCDNCGSGLYCDGATSTCRRKSTCADYGATGVATAPCSHAYAEGGGGTIDCGCGTGLLCTNGTQLVTGSAVGTCLAPKTCASYQTHGGAIGDSCSAVSSSAFPVGDGSGLECHCSTATAPNNRCVGSSASQAGTCQCSPSSCTVLGTGYHPNNGCGVPVTCGG